MMTKNILFKRLCSFSLFIVIILILTSCKSTDRKTGFEMQAEIWGERDSTEKQIYLTSALPIDSADVNKLIFDIWRIESDKYPNEIRLMARVYDSLGHFITNMAKPYLKDTTQNYWTGLTEYLGKKIKRPPVPIDSFTVREFGANDSIPYNIVMSVDYSGSMSAVIDAIYEGTEIFVNMKMKYDQIALTSFNKDLDVKVPLMSEKNQILNIYRVKREQNFGLFSGVYDALYNCINLFENTDIETPRVLVLFTDGDDNYSKKKIGELIDRAKKEKIHIFAVAFGYSKDENLRYMAQYTGGKFYKAYTKEELISIFRDIYMSLRYFYLVSYKPPKFWGYHKVIAALNVPEREDTLFAQGEYRTDIGDVNPWDSTSVFERPILFDFDKWDLKPESIPIIEEVVDLMLSYPRFKLEIQGHTDNVGGVEYNMGLSERRANAVMEKMLEMGVEPRRLRSRGFGFSVPKVSNETDEGRATNRRTEFHLLAK